MITPRKFFSMVDQLSKNERNSWQQASVETHTEREPEDDS